MTSSAAGPRTASRAVVVQLAEGRADRPDDRGVRIVGAARPRAAAQDGPRLGQFGDARQALVEEPADADPGRATQDQRPRASARRVVQHGRESREGDLTPHEPRARIAGGHGGILGATLGRVTEGRPLPHPANALNDLTRRGVAVLHQVGPHDGLSIRARPRGSQGPRREQAAAADGPAHRVLLEDRRARPRPVRGGRRHAARGRRSRAVRGGPSASNSTRAGRPSTNASSRTCSASATGCGPVLDGPGPGGPGRAAAVRSVGRRDARRRRAGGPADAGRRLDRPRRDRPALQRPAAADDGRRRAGRGAREPADRLRDDQRPRRRPRQQPGLRDVPRPDGDRPRRVVPRAARRPLRAGHRARRLPGRPVRVHRLGPGRASGARRARPEGRSHLVPGRQPAAAVRLSARVRPEHRPPAHPGVPEGDLRPADVSPGVRATGGRRVRTSSSTSSPIVQVSAAIGIVAVAPFGRGASSSATTSPRVILWIQPWPPFGHRTSQYVPWRSRSCTSSPWSRNPISTPRSSSGTSSRRTTL